MNLGQILPHSKDAEDGIVASMFLDPEYSIPFCRKINVDIFYRELPKRIFVACLKTYSEKKDIDLTLVCENAGFGKIEAQYIHDIFEKFASARILTQYIEIVTEKFIQREILKKNETQNKQILENSFNFQAYKKEEKLTTELIENCLTGAVNGKINMANVWDTNRMLEAYRAHIDNLKMNLFVTGIENIDKIIRGVSGGEVLTIIARAGCFKTAFLQNMIRRYCRKSQESACFFSLEMPIASVVERYHSMISIKTGRDIEAMYINKEYNKTKIIEAENKFKESLKNLYIIPTKSSVDAMEHYVSLIEKERKTQIGMLGIDYMGMIDGGSGKEYDVISKVSRGVKDLAKKLNTPIVLLAQTSRAGADGKSEIELSHGRGSGAIEEAADFLLGMWTDDDKNCPANSRGDERKVICKILKNRKGPIGSKWALNVRANTMSFGTYSERYEPQNKQNNFQD